MYMRGILQRAIQGGILKLLSPTFLNALIHETETHNVLIYVSVMLRPESIRYSRIMPYSNPGAPGGESEFHAQGRGPARALEPLEPLRLGFPNKV